MGTGMTTHRILIVDDDSDVLLALKRSLYSKKLEIETTRSPTEALQILKENEIDLLLSDLDMPDMDGLGVLNIARMESPQTIRVLITGVGSRESAVRAINEGEVHRYITKPWDSDKLKALVESLLERKEELGRVSKASLQASRRREVLAKLENEFPQITSISKNEKNEYELSVSSDLEESLAMTPLYALISPGQ